MAHSSVGTTGNALVAAIAGLTASSENKLRDVSRKATLARLLDDRNGASSTDNGGCHPTDKENSSRSTTTGRGLSGSGSSSGAVFSERGNCNDTSTASAPVTQTSHGNLEALRNLRDLSSIVSEVERRVAMLRDAIDSHRRDNAARREMSDMTQQQTAQLAATLAVLPEHLPHAAPTEAATAPRGAGAAGAAGAAAAAAAAASAAVSRPGPTRSGANRRGRDSAAVVGSVGGGEMAGRVSAGDVPAVPVLQLVTVAELNGVPRSTRARLTIEQINGAVAEIQKAVERRQAFLSRPRKKMSEKQRGRSEELLQQEVPAHGGQPFIAESDLRALPAFKKGEPNPKVSDGMIAKSVRYGRSIRTTMSQSLMTAKALIATLRSLKRLKGVRGTGMMTYVVQGG